ncbi:hypothetical protein Zm00014a_042050 [Zea mays]|uniref:Carbohydrate kinase PfkB domain-containing protein n=1 Tax=Zea mays TaxID=4577 RepID=A0A3L6DQ78_MAIZE|nr:hypothetical protein Zm00014a_042050 [Zea mays]
MAEPANRRMEAVRRHLLLPSPAPLRPNPLSSLAEVEPSPVIIGGMVLDIHAKPSVPPHHGTTVPGMFYSAEGDFLLKYWRSAGLCTEGILQVDNVATPVVSNVFDGTGELIAGVASVQAVITCTSPNEIELVAMANSLSPSVKYNFHKIEQFKEKADTVEYIFEMLSPAMFFLLEKGIKLLIVTLGSNGVFVCCKEHTNFMKDQHKCKQTPFSRQLLEKMDGCFPSNNLANLCRESSSRTCVFHLPAISASVISLTGAGDCLVGGVLSALCAGFDIIRSVAVGVAIAKASVESEANIPDDISAASIADDAQSVLHSAKVLWCK